MAVRLTAQDKRDIAKRKRTARAERKKIAAVDKDMLDDSVKAIRAIPDEQWQAAMEEEGEGKEA